MTQLVHVSFVVLKYFSLLRVDHFEFYLVHQHNSLCQYASRNLIVCLFIYELFKYWTLQINKNIVNV